MKTLLALTAGNLTEEKRGKAGHIVTRYQYDSDNRLVRAETPNGTTQYRYDALGRRIVKHTAQGETSVCWRKLITSAAAPPVI
ncbi:RHS repeat protein [Methylomonas sp. EbB]|uniref:RHS repeat protein n=1 Tax=Methylomonas fluvii TaxID=1854564 RepID=A0ABR9D7V8_9GAMM|nr:RHS repeat protein [Methylomonas fluvii]